MLGSTGEACAERCQAGAKGGIQRNSHSHIHILPGLLRTALSRSTDVSDWLQQANRHGGTRLRILSCMCSPPHPSLRARSIEWADQCPARPLKVTLQWLNLLCERGSETTTEDLLVLQAFAAGRPSKALNCWLFPRRPRCGAATHIRAMYLAVARRIDRV